MTSWTKRCTLQRQEGLPLQLHVEGESEETYPDLARRALRQGMDLQKLVRTTRL